MKRTMEKLERMVNEKNAKGSTSKDVKTNCLITSTNSKSKKRTAPKNAITRRDKMFDDHIQGKSYIESPYKENLYNEINIYIYIY